MKATGLLILLAILAGCAFQVQPDQLRTIKAGETTYQDLQARFGRPIMNVVNPNGRIVAYYYAHRSTWSPGAHHDTRPAEVIFIFDPDGKLKSLEFLHTVEWGYPVTHRPL
jgi:hypothetical protein